MRPSILIFVLSLLLFSCMSRDCSFQKIEMMAYNWSIFNDTTGEMTSTFLKCRKYINIDKFGNGNIYIYKSYPHPESHFFSVSIEKKIIDKILNSTTMIDSVKLAVFNGKRLMYDGPIFKLRITYTNSDYKLFDFIDLSYDNEVDNFIQLFHHLDSIIGLKKYKVLEKITDLEIARSQFSKLIINYDTTHYPKVPPPSQIDSIKVNFTQSKN
jgi:hypothetical protein